MGSGGSKKRSFPVFDGRFRVDETRRLGTGAFGRVFEAVDKKAESSKRERVAIKVETGKNRSVLDHEAQVHRRVAEAAKGERDGFFLWEGRQGKHKALVMQLMGPSLEDLVYLIARQKSGTKGLSLPTVLAVGIQAIDEVQAVHAAGYVHRDIKPANFLMGLESVKSELRLVDYGLCKTYRDVDGDDVAAGITGAMEKEPARKDLSGRDTNVTGTPMYVSARVHDGYAHGRQDDLESVGLVLVWAFKGRLPWASAADTTAGRRKRKEDASSQQSLRVRKLATSVEDLTADMPPQFADYFRLVRALTFNDEPDYDRLRLLFQDALAEATGSRDWHDVEMDWARLRRKRPGVGRTPSDGSGVSSAASPSSSPPDSPTLSGRPGNENN